MVGLKGINIVSLKMSMSASQTDHLGHCIALNQLQRQKGKQGKVIKLVNGELFQKLLSVEPYQREKSVCIVFQDSEKGGHKQNSASSINKYPFNGKCTSSFLSSYCPVLKHFPMTVVPRRRNMPTNAGSSGNTLGSIHFPELVANLNTWDVFASHSRTRGFSGLVFIMAVTIMAYPQKTLSETLGFQSMWNAAFGNQLDDVFASSSDNKILLFPALIQEDIQQQLLKLNTLCLQELTGFLP